MREARFTRAVSVVAALLALLSAFIFCNLIIFEGAPSYLVFPSTRAIGRQYLDAVLAGDLEYAASLAGSDEGCRGAMREQAQHDIELLNGAEVQNVEIDVAYSTGSTEELEGATIEFEYRASSQEQWQRGSLHIITVYHFGGWRHACGGTP